MNFLKIPVSSNVNVLNKLVKSKIPKTEYKGLIEHIHKSKDGSEFIYLRTNTKIHCIKNNGFLKDITKMSFVEIFNLKIFDDGNNIYKRTYENSFIKVIKKFNLRSKRLNQQFRIADVNTCHFFKCRLASCSYFTKETNFNVGKQENKKLLWGKFFVVPHGERESFELSFAHEAFRYFKGLDLMTDGSWKNNKLKLDSHLNRKENIGKEVICLIKVYMNKGFKRFKVVHIEDCK